MSVISSYVSALNTQSSSNMSSEEKQFKSLALSEKKVLWVNRFKGNDYVHIKDKAKDKTITFTLSEFRTLFKKKNKIVAVIKQVTTQSKRKRHESEDEETDDFAKKKRKKSKKYFAHETDEESGGESEDSDW